MAEAPAPTESIEYASPADLEPVVVELARIQKEKRWTDGEMAAELQCSTAAWRSVRAGERRMGRLVLDGAFRRWPELQLIYARWLRETSA